MHSLITNSTQSLFKLVGYTACHASVFYSKNKNFVQNKIIKLYICTKICKIDFFLFVWINHVWMDLLYTSDSFGYTYKF